MTSPIALKPRIEKLGARHDVSSFDCGSEPLNRFLRVYAVNSQAAGSAQTYVSVAGGDVTGYYSLTVGDMNFGDAPERLKKGMPRHRVPVVILGRLAVDIRWQGHKVGQGLLLDALERSGQVADVAGVRGVLVRAKDDRARDFYAHFGFEPTIEDPLVLWRLLKDIRRLVDA